MKHMELLTYDKISYNEPVLFVENHWQRKLTEHEKHLVSLVYQWTRTTQEVEELKLVEVIR